MKILIIADCKEWAIGTLTNNIIEHNDRHEFHIVYAHPRNTGEAISEIELLLKDTEIDLVHYQYWRSGTQLIDAMPILKDIPSVCTHHNHAHLEKEDWKKYFNALVTQTNYGVDKLKTMHDDVTLIPHGLDLDEFNYIEKRSDKQKTVGYIGRVLPHKNLGKICEVANKLTYKVLGSGYIDKPDYWNEHCAKWTENGVLNFKGGVGRDKMNTWEDKNKTYDDMSVFVMYSTNEYETGTLPLLEAMAKGVPVMATEQGMARDLIKDGENGIIFNEENFEEKLDMLMKDRDLQEKLRQNARKTMNSYTQEKMAIQYEEVYNKTLFKEKLVSVIVPTMRGTGDEKLMQIVKSVEGQTYKNIELILVNDDKFNLMNERTFAGRDIPVKVINTNNEGYGLALARNIGVVEARGELLVFMDDRLAMDKNAVKEFVENTQYSEWNFGDKQTDGKSGNNNFVENFSAVHKSNLVAIGMFNERITMYGGMSEDIRNKCKEIHITHRKINTAISHQIESTGKMKKLGEIPKAKTLLWKLWH